MIETTTEIENVHTIKTDRELIEDLIDSHNQILSLLSEITGQIQPVIEGVSKSPIGKMLGM